MDLMTKFEFTSTNSHDILEKIKIRTEAMGLETVYYADNIISSVNVGKRLHVKIGSNYLNIASGVQRNPTVTTGSVNTNWQNSSLQVVAATISRTFSSSNSWFGNETITAATNVPVVETRNNQKTWIFTNTTSIIIITNYDSIYYTTMVINFNGSKANLSSTKKNDINTSTLLLPSNTLYSNVNSSVPTLNIFAGAYAQGTTSLSPLGVSTYDYNSSIQTRMFNLVTNTSAFLGLNVIIRKGSSGNSGTLLWALKNITWFNLKGVDPQFIFEIETQQYQVFPVYTKDNSINESMGYIIRIQ